MASSVCADAIGRFEVWKYFRSGLTVCDRKLLLAWAEKILPPGLRAEEEGMKGGDQKISARVFDPDGCCRSFVTTQRVEGRTVFLWFRLPRDGDLVPDVLRMETI